MVCPGRCVRALCGGVYRDLEVNFEKLLECVVSLRNVQDFNFTCFVVGVKPRLPQQEKQGMMDFQNRIKSCRLRYLGDEVRMKR